MGNTETDSQKVLEDISERIKKIFDMKQSLDISDKISCKAVKHVLCWEVAKEYQKKADSLSFILEVICDELQKSLKDDLVLSLLVDNLNRRCDANRVNYLLGNFSKKDWFIEEYRKKVMKKYKLPETELLIHVSAMEYEKRFNKSTLCFFTKGLDKCDNKMLVKFISDDGPLLFATDNLRTIKKYMELAGKNNSLLISVCKKDGKYEYKMLGIVKNNRLKEGSVYIDIKSKLSWVVYRNVSKQQDVLLDYREGVFHIPFLEPKNEVSAQLSKLDGYLESKDAATVKAVIECASQFASHGTGLVFIGDKGKNKNKHLLIEVDRLTNLKRARKIQPRQLDKKLIESSGVTAIDGAILLNLEGECYGVGAIVDGKAILEGDPGRGARFNSLYTYGSSLVKDAGKIYFVVAVISEDGMVDIFIPDTYTNATSSDK
ncbi:hypothetical protein bpr_I0374 [Butyrivibrio proteoclasticus B316]|uniref:DAC domain-containing protein n=1 Tax=Butyrivibrio proteoclasticus (strain ATCC 51982 / DSM 14932 / B316) TaxID=515622 RepID=E0RZC5_BUTPB|nr:hypothetical protein [Butyrivibrio proteoclasticus]ADL33122.1 hypothetical protein bpr_I0374 [Butyrivibrio proteoclasticus B316]